MAQLMYVDGRVPRGQAPEKCLKCTFSGSCSDRRRLAEICQDSGVDSQGQQRPGSTWVSPSPRSCPSRPSCGVDPDGDIVWSGSSPVHRSELTVEPSRLLPPPAATAHASATWATTAARVPAEGRPRGAHGLVWSRLACGASWPGPDPARLCPRPGPRASPQLPVPSLPPLKSGARRGRRLEGCRESASPSRRVLRNVAEPGQAHTQDAEEGSASGTTHVAAETLRG